MSDSIKILSPEFKFVLDLIENEGKNAFITGRAGTGKSTLLQLFRKTTRKNTVVLAPTGVAALNVGGQTIHSFFRFPAQPLAKKDIRRHRQHKLYKKIEVLIIDEISMVRADLLDNIDIFLQRNRDNPAPFGGVQLVFFGDLFQLPPVVATEAEKLLFTQQYESPYFFSAEVFARGFELDMVELRKVYRQNGRHFLRLLEGIRLNQLDYDDLEDLNERYDPNFRGGHNYITLSARNATVNEINRRALAALPVDEKVYLATIKGDFRAQLYPTEAALKLKLGAQVMFIKNDPDHQFVNGTIGTIRKLQDDSVVVAFQTGKGHDREIEVKPMEWEILRYKLSEDNPEKIETETLGSFRQLPLKLAWAITIHKSQGKTFDHVIIDLGKGAFEHGQTYVAFSRCRTLEGIVLKQKLRPRDIITDERIVDYYERNF